MDKTIFLLSKKNILPGVAKKTAGFVYETGFFEENLIVSPLHGKEMEPKFNSFGIDRYEGNRWCSDRLQ